MGNKAIQVDYDYLNKVSEHLGISNVDLRDTSYIYVFDPQSTISANQNCQEACGFADDIRNEIASLLEMDRVYVRKYGIEFGNLDSELLPRTGVENIFN
ncbi:MAG: hypothetical protein J6K26_05195 [Lachnospiraceae bacterium]|nr:hypothetical protein [Lachnospiraceae bacterium]